MKRFVKTLAVAAAVVVWATPVCFAQQDDFFDEPTVDYSADEVTTDGDTTHLTKTYYSPGKLRTEQDFGSLKQTNIVRHDLGLLWILNPDSLTYWEKPLSEIEGLEEKNNPPEDAFGHTEIGEEIVNGITAIKFEIVIKDPDGETYEGLAWLTVDGIIVKMQNEQMTLELKNLKVEPQDPELFELPKEYEKLPMPGMME